MQVFAAVLAAAAAGKLAHDYKFEVKHDHQHYPADVSGGQSWTGEGADFHAYPKYTFEYGVHDPHTHDHKSQWEMRDGDVVKGAYTLDEADGTVRKVTYHADDKSGFHAKVEKIGHAAHV